MLVGQQPASWPRSDEEAARLRAVDSFRHLTARSSASEATQLLDALADLGAQCLRAPLCAISIIDEDSQHLIGASCAWPVGMRVMERGASFCTHGVLPCAGDAFCVSDVSCDSRFRSNPLVVGEPHIRFYAGAPLLHKPTGQRLGMLCILGSAARTLGPLETSSLCAAAEVVMECLELLVSPVRAERPSPMAALARFSAVFDACAAESAFVGAADGRAGAQGAGTARALGDVAALPLRLTDPLVKCLGWEGLPVAAVHLTAALREVCAELGLLPVPDQVAGCNTTRRTFEARADRRAANPMSVIVLVWPTSTLGAHDVQVRRLYGDTIAFHDVIRRMGAALCTRLPELTDGALPLRRT